MQKQTAATAATRIAETRAAYGVQFAFGIPGNDVLELIRACESQGIRFVLAKSEPAAGAMADAVAQVTGRPAVCIFALGPGVANGVTGVGNALLDRTPVLILGGEMASGQRGLYTHQVFDHVALMTPVTKWAAELNPKRAAQQTAKALDIALTEPFGPVYLNCPADASRAGTDEPAAVDPTSMRPAVSKSATIDEVRAVLSQAKTPLGLIGLGALRAGVAAPLQAFLEGWGIPFLTTFKAKGAASERQPLALGALALSPVVDAVTLELIGEADQLTLIGFDSVELRDSWLDGWGCDKACVTVDWTAQTDRMFPQGVQVVGDVAANLTRLADGASSAARWPADRLDTYRREVARIVAPREPEAGISPAALLAEIDASLDAQGILTVDVGAHRILACHVLRCLAPNQLLQTNGMCAMGYAIPAASAAALALPQRRVTAIVGDGCALMSLGELALVAEHDLPVTVVVLNDSSLALIELKQSKMQIETGSVRFTNPDFVQLAQGFGIPAVRAVSNAEFQAAYGQARSAPGPMLIEAVCDPREYWDQM